MSFSTMRSGATRAAPAPARQAAGIVDRVAAVAFDGGQARLLQQALGSLGLSVEAWIAVLVVDTGSPRD